MTGTDDKDYLHALDVVGRADARLCHVIREMTRGGASYAYRTSVMRPFEEAKMELQMLRAGMLNARGNPKAARELMRDPQPPRALLQTSKVLIEHSDSVLGEDALPRELVAIKEQRASSATMTLCQELQTLAGQMLAAQGVK